jgi:hypothetical protein
MTLSEDMKADPAPEAGIVNHRSTRFLGATQTCDLSEVSSESLEGLQWLYRWLATVGEYSAKDLAEPVIRNEIEALVTRDDLDRVVDCARNVKPVQEDSTRLARILHDLRGAALTQLVGLAELWLTGPTRIGDLHAMAILAGDHAKVLRHSLIGLDEERRLLDAGRRLHGVENLRSRFPSLVLCNRDGDVQVDFAAEWNGDFAITCPEFSAALKQLYNLMDNAARHTADRTVLVRVYAKPPVEPRSVQLVVANALTRAERATLSPGVLAALWRGYTTTGSGLGLVSCAELVAEAFGVEGPERAVDLGYVGSRVTENGYIASFHWPVVSDGAA